MMDFDIIQKNGYFDIDLKNKATNKKGAILNALLEESRIPIASQQPALERGGSIKDNINNITGTRYGSLIWYFLRVYNGQEALSYIKNEVVKRLNYLKSQNIIDTWNTESLEVILENRLLTIKFSYNANSEQHKFNTSI